MKNILITGSNRGIGLSIAEGILKKLNKETNVFLTSRDPIQGLQIINSLKLKYPDVSKNILYHQLDIENITSISKLKHYFFNNNIKVDVLINNAGYLEKLQFKESFVNKDSERTIKTNRAIKTFSINMFSLMYFTKSLVKNNLVNSKIINVTSSIGKLSFEHIEGRIQPRDYLLNAKKFDDLFIFYNEYLKSINEGREWRYQESDVYNSYGPSKMGLNMYTELLAKDNPNLEVTCFTPGWCRTRMGGDLALRSSEKGAECGIWLAESNVDLKRSGKYFYDKNEESWYKK